MDITTTATLRPRLLRQTYTSFRDRMFEGSFEGCRLYLNVDPVGEAGVTQDDVVAVAREFFDDVVTRCPDAPSVPQAWCWLFNVVSDHFVFNLEDDWIMTQNCRISDLTAIMSREPNLALLRLTRFAAGEESCRQWNKSFIRHGDYYECPEEVQGMLGFSGNPSLIRGDFLRGVGQWLVPWGCPEKQIKRFVHPIAANRDHVTRFIQQQIMHVILEQWTYGVYTKPGWENVVADAGGDWRKDHGVDKLHGREHW